MEPKNTSVMVDRNFGTILICAVRYSLGRRTYMPQLVVDYITPLLPHLQSGTLDILLRDVHSHGANGMHPEAYGEPCDQLTWTKFMAKVQEEIERRVSNGSYRA